MNRRQAREKALQVLFQLDLNEQEPQTAINNVLEEEEGNPFLDELVFGTTSHKEEIDTLLRSNLENWTIERIGNVDRAILRLAIYEMQFEPNIPINVTLNEAIELAKTFGDDDSGKFINSVLSKVKDQLPAK